MRVRPSFPDAVLLYQEEILLPQNVGDSNVSTGECARFNFCPYRQSSSEVMMIFDVSPKYRDLEDPLTSIIKIGSNFSNL